MSDFTEIDIPETLHIEQTGAAQETPTEDTERQPSPRDVAMAAIAERRREAIERELAYGVEMEDQARADGGGEPIERNQGEQPENSDGAEAGGSDGAPSPPIPARVAAPAPSGTPDASAPDERRHQVEVGGQRFSLTDAELQHLATIGATVSVQAQQQPRQPTLPQQQGAPAYQPQQTPQQPAQPAAAAPDRTKLAETWRRLSYGSEEDGVAALTELLAAAAPPQQQLDPVAIANYASQQTRQQIALESNLMTIGREFPDVFGPADKAPATAQEAETYEMRAQLAALALDKIRRRDAVTGLQRSDLDVYREAATRVRASFGGNPAPQSGATSQAAQPATQAARPTVAQRGETLERKRAAPRQPQAVSRSPSAGDIQPRPRTASEVVAQLALARHQQSPVRV